MSTDRVVTGNAVKSTPSPGGGKRGSNPTLAFERRTRTRPQVVQGWHKTFLPRGPQAPHLEACKVDIWIARTDSILRSKSTLKLLSTEDWNEFERQHVPAAHDSAIAARILLRLALSRAAGFRIVPSSWNFKRTAYGRLMLSDTTDLHFSLSHVDDIVAVAVASGADLGFDLENIDRHISSKVIATFLHPHERLALEPLPNSQKMREFIRLWTKKEAYTKLLGLGHSIDFATLNFATGSIRHDRPDSRILHLFESFDTSVGRSVYHGSLAMKSTASGAEPVEVQMISVLAPGES